MPNILWFFAAVAATFVYGSFFEWTLHKFIMHRPFPGFKYPFKAHAVVHHRIFRADHTYHLKHEADKETIPMAWWNGPVIVFVACLPFAGLAWWLGELSVLAGSVAAMSLYYLFYEGIHWCMHLPKARRLEMTSLFRRLNGHHLLHHRYMHKNFNVVLPLADLCLGTLLRRSKIRFAQASGPSVPDLQPIG